MRAGIDFFAQNLLSTFNRQRSDLLTQSLTRLNGLLLSLGFGSNDDFVRFFSRAAFGFFNDSLGAALCVSQQTRRLFATSRQFGFYAFIGRGQFGFGTVSRTQTISDFLPALVQCLHDRRPNEFGRKPHQKRKDNPLKKQGRIDIHFAYPF